MDFLQKFAVSLHHLRKPDPPLWRWLPVEALDLVDHSVQIVNLFSIVLEFVLELRPKTIELVHIPAAANVVQRGIHVILEFPLPVPGAV